MSNLNVQAPVDEMKQIYKTACPECGTHMEVDSIRLFNVSGMLIQPNGSFNIAEGTFESFMEWAICPNCEYTTDELERI